VLSGDQPFRVLVVGGGHGGRSQGADGGSQLGGGSIGIEEQAVTIPAGAHTVTCGRPGDPGAPYVWPTPGGPSSFLTYTAQGGQNGTGGGGWNHTSDIAGTDEMFSGSPVMGDQFTGSRPGQGYGAGGGACNGPGGQCGASWGNPGCVIVAYQIAAAP
jgi:hypothetical protein